MVVLAKRNKRHVGKRTEETLHRFNVCYESSLHVNGNIDMQSRRAQGRRSMMDWFFGFFSDDDDDNDNINNDGEYGILHCISPRSISPWRFVLCFLSHLLLVLSFWGSKSSERDREAKDSCYILD